MTYTGAPDFLQVSRNVLARIIDQTPVTISANSVVTNTYNAPQTGDVVWISANCANYITIQVDVQDVTGTVIQTELFAATYATNPSAVAVEPKGGAIVLKLWNSSVGTVTVNLSVLGYVGAALDDVLPRHDMAGIAATGGAPFTTASAIIKNTAAYSTLNYFATCANANATLQLFERPLNPSTTTIALGIPQTNIALPAGGGSVRGSQPIAGGAVYANVTTTNAGGDNLAVSLKAYR